MTKRDGITASETAAHLHEEHQDALIQDLLQELRALSAPDFASIVVRLCEKWLDARTCMHKMTGQRLDAILNSVRPQDTHTKILVRAAQKSGDLPGFPEGRPLAEMEAHQQNWLILVTCDEITEAIWKERRKRAETSPTILLGGAALAETLRDNRIGVVVERNLTFMRPDRNVFPESPATRPQPRTDAGGS